MGSLRPGIPVWRREKEPGKALVVKSRGELFCAASTKMNSVFLGPAARYQNRLDFAIQCGVTSATSDQFALRPCLKRLRATIVFKRALSRSSWRRENQNRHNQQPLPKTLCSCAAPHVMWSN